MKWVTDRQTSRQTEGLAGRKVEGGTDRQTNWQAEADIRHGWQDTQMDDQPNRQDEATDGCTVTHLIQKLSKQRTRKAMGRPKPR